MKITLRITPPSTQREPNSLILLGFAQGLGFLARGVNVSTLVGPRG